MLSFNDYIIDEQLSNLSEELQENFIKNLLDKMGEEKKKDLENHIIKVNNARDKDTLEKYSEHPHFAVRLAVARNKNTHPNTLKKLKGGHSEYKSVASAAEDTLRALNTA